MTPEERREILEMVASGKITADEASSLLQGDAAEKVAPPPAEQLIAVEEETAEPPQKAAAPSGNEQSGPARRRRWLHIQVNDLKSGNRRVSVNIPLGLVRAGLALGGNVAPELRGFDWSEFSSALLDEQGGMIVEVKDEEDGEHVQIFVD